MMSLSSPLSSSDMAKRRERGSRVIAGLFACSFAFPLLASALPLWILRALGSPLDKFPGLRHLAQLSVDPDAAAVDLAISMLLAIAVLLVSLGMPVPAQRRATALAAMKRVRPIFVAIGGVLLILAILFHVPEPAGRYQLSYSFIALLGKSRLAVAVLCSGLCMGFSACFMFIRLLFDRGENV